MPFLLLLLTALLDFFKPNNIMLPTIDQNINTVTVSDDLALPYLVRPAGTKSDRQKAIIFLHGVGSNEQDLFRLAPLLPDNFVVISPRGPYTLGAGRYAWYQVDFSTGKPVINEQQAEHSRQVIKAFIQQVKQQYAVEEVYLGGFSQGGIMSYSVGLASPGAVSGILSFSGRILQEIKPLVQKDKVLEQLKVFVAHGVQDGTLPVLYAREAKAFLQQLGVPLSYHEFDMGHQINDQVLQAMLSWLAE
jgi:phospholipase/carboxylesterase